MTRILVSLILVLLSQAAMAAEVEITWPTLRSQYRPDTGEVLVFENSRESRVPDSPIEPGKEMWGDRSGSIPTSHTCLRLCGTNLQCILECMRDKGDG